MLGKIWFVSLVCVFAVIGLQGCGSSACDSMMSQACDDCEAQFSPEWEAACSCYKNSSFVKVNGFHCSEAIDWDEDVCRITLDLWEGQKSCDMMNRALPFRDKLPDLSN